MIKRIIRFVKRLYDTSNNDRFVACLRRGG